MLFQVINNKDVPVMRTEYISCISDESQLSVMVKAGYKFRLDGKVVSKKKVLAFVNADKSQMTPL